MKFVNEKEFREWIVIEVSKLLDENWVVLHGKNVSDVVLCKNDQSRPLMLFVEAKYHQTKHRRTGFGNGSGAGYQPEILLKRPLYLEKYMRWIIVDQDSERCLLLANSDVRNNCAREIKEGKQNNFTRGLFNKNEANCFNIVEVPLRIAEWATQQ